MKQWGRLMKAGLVGWLVAGILVVGGCEGTETRSDVDDTVEELAGKKNLDRYHRMKKNIEDIKQRQASNHEQLDDRQHDE
jgi:hypothetical protein